MPKARDAPSVHAATCGGDSGVTASGNRGADPGVGPALNRTKGNAVKGSIEENCDGEPESGVSNINRARIDQLTTNSIADPTTAATIPPPVTADRSLNGPYRVPPSTRIE